MSEDEAKTVGRLIGYADSACSTCVGNLIEIANRVFPEWEFTAGNTIDVDWDAEPVENPAGWPEASRIDVVVKRRAALSDA